MGERPKKKKKEYIGVPVDIGTRDQLKELCELHEMTYDKMIRDLMKLKNK